MDVKDFLAISIKSEDNDESAELENVEELSSVDGAIKPDYEDSWDRCALDSPSTSFAEKSLENSSDSFECTSIKLEAVEGSDVSADEASSPQKGDLDFGEIPSKVTDTQMTQHEIDSNSHLKSKAANEEANIDIKTESNDVSNSEDYSNEGIPIASEKMATKVKEKIKQYPCIVCGERLATAETLKQHTGIHTREKPLKCKFCRICFKDQSQLKRHQLSHKSGKRHECELCGKGFRGGYELRRHIKVHTGEKPYSCELCDKRFIEPHKVKEHISRVHSLERPHQCTFCGKRFSTSYNLKTHELTHNIRDTDTRYSCKFCNKRCENLNRLKSHLKIHTGGKLLDCEFCGRSFTKPGHLNYHMQASHYESMKYNCDICGESLLFNDLQSHKLNHAKNPNETYILP